MTSATQAQQNFLASKHCGKHYYIYPALHFDALIFKFSQSTTLITFSNLLHGWQRIIQFLTLSQVLLGVCIT